MVGEGAEFYSVKLPSSLSGKTLAESGIGARTGLVVIAIETPEGTMTNPPAGTILVPSSRLLMLGTNEQRERFNELIS